MNWSKIILAVQTLLVIVAVAYGYLQRTEADAQRKIAEEQRALAMQNEMEAVRQKKLAETIQETALKMQEEAERQRALAEQTLKDCQSRK